MATLVERALHMEVDPIPTTYYTTTSNSIRYNKPAEGLVPAGNIYINGATSAVLSLNQVALDILYPNDTAKPIKASFGDSAMGGLMGNSIFNVRFQGVNIGANISQGYNARQTIWRNDLTPPEVTNYNKTNTNIQFFIQSTSGWGAIFDWLELKLFFNLYDVGAEKDIGIQTVEASASTAYEGDQVTFTAAVEDGFSFDGWYANETLVSINPTYTAEISQDTILTARAYSGEALNTGLYIKNNGVYVPVCRVFKKINGRYENQLNLVDVLPSNKVYVRKEREGE